MDALCCLADIVQYSSLLERSIYQRTACTASDAIQRFPRRDSKAANASESVGNN